MNFINGLNEFQIANASDDFPLALAIGMFDGVHLGHQEVISFTKKKSQELSSKSKCAVFTFDKHPASIFRPEAKPDLIYPLDKRIECLEASGVDYVFVIDFDPVLCRLSARDFISTLTRTLPNLKEICVGRDFGFGHRREGNIEKLKEFSNTFQFKAHEVPAFQLDNQNISSTLIRDHIKNGLLDKASALIGRQLTISGKVIKGRQVGRTIGFPTANIDAKGLCLPPFGVYSGFCTIGDRKTLRLPAIMNIGLRPTISAGDTIDAPSLEVHIPDFNKNIYGENLEFSYGQFIRSEIKFRSLEDLKSQIQKDIQSIKSLEN